MDKKPSKKEEDISKKAFQSSKEYSKEEKLENIIALGALVVFLVVIVGLATDWYGLRQKNPLDEQFPPSQIFLRAEASMGSKKAPIIIVELSDFECPFCGQFEREVFPQIKKEYVDSGEAMWFFMEFPLRAIHPHSYKAAIAAECARIQNKFWEYHDILYAHQDALDRDSLLTYANNLSLDMKAFTSCVDNNETEYMIQEAARQARNAGITATPSFIIGKPGMGDSVNGFKIIGVESLDTFRKLIEATKHKRNN